MHYTTAVSRVEVVTAPTQEPLTVARAKKQLHLSTSDTSADEELVDHIQAAREQWENDTDSAVMTQTLRVTAERLYGREIQLPRRPIQSLTTVTYYDTSDVSQTLSASIYSFDKQGRSIRLKWNESWPSLALRWDAVTITYVAGYTKPQLVPAVAKQAMLLLIGYYFDANRGDNDRPNDRRAYEALVAKYMRSTYP